MFGILDPFVCILATGLYYKIHATSLTSSAFGGPQPLSCHFLSPRSLASCHFLYCLAFSPTMYVYMASSPQSNQCSWIYCSHWFTEILLVRFGSKSKVHNWENFGRYKLCRDWMWQRNAQKPPRARVRRCLILFPRLPLPKHTNKLQQPPSRPMGIRMAALDSK